MLEIHCNLILFLADLGRSEQESRKTVGAGVNARICSSFVGQKSSGLHFHLVRMENIQTGKTKAPLSRLDSPSVGDAGLGCVLASLALMHQESRRSEEKSLYFSSAK